jgi:hypothetical protein
MSRLVPTAPGLPSVAVPTVRFEAPLVICRTGDWPNQPTAGADARMHPLSSARPSIPEASRLDYDVEQVNTTGSAPAYYLKPEC